MTEQFDWVEGSSKSTVSVRHPEGHRYEFYIVGKQGRRVLGEGSIIHEDARGKHGAGFFMQEARAFAEREARQRGIID
jgi:hypothetical protein